MLNVDSLLAAELCAIRSRGILTDESLRRLDAFLCGDGILERALEALDGGAVTKITSSPSGRVVWSIASSLSRRTSADLAGIDLHASGLTVDNYSYTVLLDGPGSCTCADFTAHVIIEGETASRRVCKHILAAALADALGSASRVRARGLSDEELIKLLIQIYS